MKKIINGKKYNTETAKEIGYADNGLGRNDFNYWSETLYQKRTGEFFKYGEGGAASSYSRKCGTNDWCGSEAIIPLSESEAKEWAEAYLDVDEYEAIFGDVEE